MTDKRSEYVVASAPGRVDLSGGPTDWCGMNTLAMAINLRAFAKVTLLDNTELIRIKIGEENVEYTTPTYDGKLDLFKAVIELTGLKGFSLECWTDIPRGSGLGGSAPLTVASVFALNKLFDKKWSKYYMAELAQRSETFKLHTVNGYQDQYTAMFGGVLFMDFRGKSCQRGDYSKSVESEPYTVVENLTDYLPKTHIVVAVPKVTRISSDQTNGSLSDRYLDNEPLIVEAIEKMAKNTQLAKKALVDRDSAKLFELVNADNNTLRLFNFLTPDNEMIIKTSMELGAIAGKTCGAGRGAVALFAPSHEIAQNIYAKLQTMVENIYYVVNDEGARYEESI